MQQFMEAVNRYAIVCHIIVLLMISVFPKFIKYFFLF